MVTFQLPREEWRATMLRTPVPKKGCFYSSYPSTEWQEEPCTTAPQRRYIGGSKSYVAAKASGTISSATGSFDSVTGVTSETGGPSNTPNRFSLQLNTDQFDTPAEGCNAVDPRTGVRVRPNCKGWQQFVYSNEGSKGWVLMQYELSNYAPLQSGITCPPGWDTDTSSQRIDCYKKSSAAKVPAQTIANLAQLSLKGEANAGGTDTVVLSIASELHATAQDSVLNLAGSWREAEFNIFGDGNLEQAKFNDDGTTIVVRTSLDDGTTNAPTCAVPPPNPWDPPTFTGTTGETNNLYVMRDPSDPTKVECSPIGGAWPAIVFTETNAARTTSGPDLAPCGWCYSINPYIQKITFNGTIKNVGTSVWKSSTTGYYVIGVTWGPNAEFEVEQRYTLGAYPNFPPLDPGQIYPPGGITVDFNENYYYRGPGIVLYHPEDTNPSNNQLVTPQMYYKGKDFSPNEKLYDHECGCQENHPNICAVR
jgi:hypothetical protein